MSAVILPQCHNLENEFLKAIYCTVYYPLQFSLRLEGFCLQRNSKSSRGCFYGPPSILLSLFLSVILQDVDGQTPLHYGMLILIAFFVFLKLKSNIIMQLTSFNVIYMQHCRTLYKVI